MTNNLYMVLSTTCFEIRLKLLLGENGSGKFFFLFVKLTMPNIAEKFDLKRE